MPDEEMMKNFLMVFAFVLVIGLTVAEVFDDGRRASVPDPTAAASGKRASFLYFTRPG